MVCGIERKVTVLRFKNMLTKDKAIEMSLQLAIEEYETFGIEIINAEFDSKDDEWLVTFRVWEWLTSEWRVWEYEGKVYCDLFAG